MVIYKVRNKGRGWYAWIYPERGEHLEGANADLVDIVSIQNKGR